MFRRKDEGAADSSDVSASPTTSSPTGSSVTGSESSLLASSQPSPAAQSPLGTQTSFSQAPQVQPVVRPLTEASRPAPVAVSPASAPTPGYRPATSPVSDFNRGVTRPGQEAGRPGGHTLGHPVSNAEKSTKPNSRILTVGNDILLKGEIATCDRIIIEGRVEAKLHDVHTVEIAVSGSFKGTADVEEAEISGLFEGDLAVRTRLVIYSTGEVRGNITYGEIEIERGGKLTGQIKTVSSHPSSEAKTNLLDALEGKHSRGGKDKEAAA